MVFDKHPHWNFFPYKPSSSDRGIFVSENKLYPRSFCYLNRESDEHTLDLGNLGHIFRETQMILQTERMISCIFLGGQFHHSQSGQFTNSIREIQPDFMQFQPSCITRGYRFYFDISPPA